MMLNNSVPDRAPIGDAGIYRGHKYRFDFEEEALTKDATETRPIGKKDEQ
jgi:hypothetical protein